MFYFKPSAELTVYTVDEILKQFLVILNSDEKDIVIDLNEVHDVDGCGVQLLLYLREVARKQQKSLYFQNFPDFLKDALLLLNVGRSFQLSQEEL